MKKLALAMVFFLLNMTAYGENYKVTVTNNTGAEIHYLHLAPSSNEEWEDDLLKGKVLKDGQSFVINVKGYDTYEFDIKLEDSDGNTYTKYNLDFSDRGNRKIVLTSDDMDPPETGYGYGYGEGEEGGP